MVMRISLFILMLACYAHHSEAVACPLLTNHTCTKSLYVTGICSQDVCQCKTGYDPIKYGCQKKIKPTVNAATSDVEFDGYALTGGVVELSCDVGIMVYDGYTWYRDDLEESAEIGPWKTVTVNKADDAGDFRCQVELNGVKSEKSEAFEIKFADDLAAIGTSNKPKLDGVQIAFTDQELKLRCVNIPAATNVKYALKTRNSLGPEKDSPFLKYSVTAKSPKLSCVVKSDKKGEIESDKIDAPAGATTMPPVKIKGPSMPLIGKSATWNCDLEDAIPLPLTTWEWYKNGTKLSSETRQIYTIPSVDISDNCNLKCKAKEGALAPSESESITVTAARVTHKIVSTPAKALLKGYVSLECKVEGAGSEKITYTWKKGSDELKGVTDKMIQINDFDDGDKGKYTCNPSVGGISLGNSNPADYSTVGNLSDAIVPSVTSNKITTNFAKQKPYTLSCKSDYDTPGMTYAWTKDDTTQSGETAMDLEITAESTKHEYKCQLLFNSLTSGDSKPLSVVGKDLLSVVIYNDVGTKLGDAIFPLKHSEVELECKAVTNTGVNSTVRYEWKEGDKSLVKTQKYSFNMSRSFSLKCIATLNEETDHKEIKVTASTTIVKPTLTVDPVVTEYSKGATYTLKCETSSRSKGMTYEFVKDNTTVAGTTFNYTIKSASASNDGTYTCKAILNTESSTISDGVEIKVGEAGKYCTKADEKTQCVGKEYTGICKQKRCICAKTYVAKGGDCIEAGASAVVASLMGTLLIAIISRLF